MSNIKQATDQLHTAFRCLNDAFFFKELPEPAITIQTGGKHKTMGWCTINPIWRDREGTIQKYEINIAAEYLNYDFYETMDTLLHEMVHLYCIHKGIKDTSRGGTYHNKRFKEECLRRGFAYSRNKPDPRNGWAFPKITEESKRIIDTFPINRNAFNIARATFGRLPEVPTPSSSPTGHSNDSTDEGRRPSHVIKWRCPTCGMSVRSTKVVNVRCGDCDEQLVQTR